MHLIVRFHFQSSGNVEFSFFAFIPYSLLLLSCNSFYGIVYGLKSSIYYYLYSRVSYAKNILLRNNNTKNIHIIIQWTRFTNIQTWNSSSRVDMPLTSIINLFTWFQVIRCNTKNPHCFIKSNQIVITGS